MSDQHLRTASEARAWLDRHGVTATEWARANGFQRTVVFSVLSGRAQGRRGEAHRVAVALRIKAAATANELSPLTNFEHSFGGLQPRALVEPTGATMT